MVFVVEVCVDADVDWFVGVGERADPVVDVDLVVVVEVDRVDCGDHFVLCFFDV